MDEPSRSSMGTRWSGAAAVLLAVVLVFAAAEAFVRVALPDRASLEPPRGHFVPDERLGSRLEPRAHWWQEGDRGEFRIEYWTNDEGFRTDAPSTQRPSGPEVVVFGNSFVEGWGVPFEKGFLRRTEDALERAGTPLRLSNYGMSGYSTVQSYLLLTDLLRTRRPAAVMLVFTPGHLFDDQRFLEGALVGEDGLATGMDVLAVGTRAPSRPDPWLLRAANAAKPRLEGLALFRLVYRGLVNRSKAAGIRIGDPATDRFFFTRANVDYEAPLRTTLRYVDAMREACRGAGVPFLVVLMPYGHEVAHDEWALGRRRERLDAGVLYPDQPMTDLESRLRARSVPTLNLLPFLRSEARPDHPLYFKLDIHLNEHGNERVASALARWLGDLYPSLAVPRG